MDEFDLYPEIVVVTGTNGVVITPVEVPEGEAWKITQAVGLHDDPAARNCLWAINDGVTTYFPKSLVNLATRVTDPFYFGTYFNGPLIAFHGFNLEWHVQGVAGAQHGEVKLIVYKLRGLPVRE